MQRRLAELNDELERVWGVRLTNRTGVNTGEVVAGDPTTGQRLVTGDAVNVAARLEQAAPGDGGPARRAHLPARARRGRGRGGRAARAEGQVRAGARVPAHLGRRDGRGLRPPQRRAASSGARRSSACSSPAFDEAVDDRACRLVTVIGRRRRGQVPAARGVHAHGRGRRAGVLRGRCLSYGEGITFWPLAGGRARHAATIRDDDSPELSRRRSSARSSATTARSSYGAWRRRSASPTSRSRRGALLGRAQVARVARAASEPLSSLFDDIHWAEPTFLDLIEHLLDSSRMRRPVLATARHELLEQRPAWAERAGRDAHRARAALRRRQRADRREPARRAGLAPDVTTRIVDAAEGNPLFVEQMLSMLVDSGPCGSRTAARSRREALAELAVPPTINALLAARLDQLEARGARRRRAGLGDRRAVRLRRRAAARAEHDHRRGRRAPVGADDASSSCRDAARRSRRRTTASTTC